jgi:hypothetical protein
MFQAGATLHVVADRGVAEEPRALPAWTGSQEGLVPAVEQHPRRGSKNRRTLFLEGVAESARIDLGYGLA